MADDSEIVARYLGGESYADIWKSCGVSSERISKLVKGLQPHSERCSIARKKGKGRLTEAGRSILSEHAKKHILRQGKVWTKPEQSFKAILNNMGIGVQFPEDLRKALGVVDDDNPEICFQYPLQRYICDFVDVKRHIIYQVNGDFWHGNPLLYKQLSAIQNHNRCHDANRKIFLEKYGYVLCDIWESEIAWNVPFVEEKIRASRKRVTPSVLHTEVAEFESRDAHDWSERLRELWFKKPKERSFKIIECGYCGNQFEISAQNKRLANRRFCSRQCVDQHHRKVSRPSREDLERDLQTMSYRAVGRKYNVSDNTIKKWLKQCPLIADIKLGALTRTGATGDCGPAPMSDP